MKPLHIFKRGTHTAMNGASFDFSESDIAATVHAYDPALHEAPLVIGHPKHDAPAAGWVKSLSASAHGLTAEPQQVDAAFVEQIAKGSYKKISAFFYHPDAANNPVPGVTAQYHYAELEDIYRQHFVGLLGNQPLGGGVFKADVRLIKSTDSGAERAGSIDNRALSGMLSYAISGHTFSGGWQRMSGDNSMPYLDGSNPYLVNYVQVNDFAAAQERSWQLRYDYDFKAIGINGLSFLTRYVNGDHIKVLGSDQEGKEWERDSELKYVIQTGTFKDVSVRLRNATYRTNYEKFARDVDETRLIVSYNFSVL